jgi:UDP-N-acetylglucosamine 4-epimerase
VLINGDGETSRDFCFVANAVQANILAATTALEKAEVFNVAVGDRTTLNDLFNAIRDTLANNGAHYQLAPVYQEFRAGDVRHSQADVSKARQILGFEPSHTIWQGLDVAMPWYLAQ